MIDKERIEIETLLEAVFRVYGNDFRNYVYPTMKRRIWNRVHLERVETITGLLNKLLHDQSCMERFLRDLSISVTSMFRDPSFFLQFRQKVIPLMKQVPYIRVWIAGCATGEEAYSMAIVLEEEGLYDRSRIYATDMDEDVLHSAKSGVFPLDKVQGYTMNYLQSGGNCSFSEYYTAGYDSILLRKELKKNIIFAKHNLVTDTSFNEFHIIFCRNVMIYFNQTLRDRVYDLIFESLSGQGILALGSNESIRFTKYANFFEEVEVGSHLYRKKEE